jgi:hypothetical protein
MTESKKKLIHPTIVKATCRKCGTVLQKIRRWDKKPIYTCTVCPQYLKKTTTELPTGMALAFQKISKNFT